MRTFLSIALWLLTGPSLVAADILTAEFQQDLSAIDVQLCFDGEAASRLYRNDRASGWSDGIRFKQQRLTIREYDGTVRLPSLPPDSCLEWQVDLDKALTNSGHRSMQRLGNDLIMNADIWFWRGPRDRELEVVLQLPAGYSFSTPWKRLGEVDDNPAGELRESRTDTDTDTDTSTKTNTNTDTNANTNTNTDNRISNLGSYQRFRPANTPPAWETKLAVGKFRIQTIDIAGSQLQLAAPGDISPQQQQKFADWIKASAQPVSDVIGRFPQPDVQVLVIPGGSRSSAVLFGQVIRGGGMGVAFWVDETRPLSEFLDSWKATHEFSHLLLPYISSRDRWLSEGLASYYQNVLRARSGRLTETQAWQELYDGFERGRKGTGSGTLAQATREGRSSTMRVYWSGAALMLMADVQLRATSNGRQSLDTALGSLSECCLENGTTWRAKAMFEQLDTLTGTRVFSEIYATYANAEGFPPLQNTWKDLGINTQGNRVSLQPSAPMADIREAIMKE